MKDLNLAIVDVETTGQSAAFGRIIEIGILVIEKGELVETFSSLVNPEQGISPFISGLTGISSQDLGQAPTFQDIQEKIRALLKDRIFVAHNARFDYGFIKNEFKRLGISFSARLLCTVRLSRKLFPREKKHNLDALIQRFQLTCVSRHRALDDARALWGFLQHVSKNVADKEREDALRSVLKTPRLPPQLPESVVQKLPESVGVYIFYNETGTPLYIGKSINIRDRVLSHLSDTQTKEMNLVRQLADIESISTSSELGALLLESHLIKKRKPLFNRRLRAIRKLVIASRIRPLHEKGYDLVEIQTLTSLTPKELPDLLGIFRSTKKAKEFLYEQADQYGLCPRLLGLEKGKGPCFSSQLKKCRGACHDADPPALYNLRLEQAFSQSKLRRWPYSGPVLIEEKRESGDSEGFIVDQWCLVGTLKSDAWQNNGEDCVMDEGPYVFDYDAYKILVRCLLKPSKNIRVQLLPKN